MNVKFFAMAFLIAATFGAHPANAQTQDLRQACYSYGFTPGTDAFAQCVFQLDQKRLDRKTEKRQRFRNFLGALGRSMTQGRQPRYQQRRPMNCSTFRLGHTLQTNCY